MDKIRAICKRHNIEVCHMKDVDLLVYAQALSSGDTKLGISHALVNRFKPKIKLHKKIGLMPDSQLFVLWHEVGHLVHPLGMGGNILVNELAASSWTILNYDPHEDELCQPMEEFKQDLQDALMTYIRNGYNKCPNNDTYRIMARIIGVEDKITWVNKFF